MNVIRKQFQRKPSTLIYQSKAFLPSSGLKNLRTPLMFEFQQSNVQISNKEALALFKLCEMEVSENLPIIFPQIIGLPLIMALLAHPKFPEPIWNGLQVRNVIKEHHAIKVGERLEFSVKSSEFQYITKGAELDLIMNVRAGEKLLWESVTTLYFKGKFGIATKKDPKSNSKFQGSQVASWITSIGGGIKYGSISGDYNGIHLSNLYAKMFGFKKAFFHPHRVVGRIIQETCVLGEPLPKKLSLWFKGPVPYNSKVNLIKNSDSNSNEYALYLDSDHRPCVLLSMD